jgi:hypothetical protein
MFAGPEYASYVALMRELRLEREFEWGPRFLRHVELIGSNQCWLWTGKPSTHGYGKFMTPERRIIGSHRAAWHLFTGEPPPTDRQVLHRCDVKLCVNPAHLYLGEHLDNVRDQLERGLTPRGTVNAAARLTEEVVAEIRRRYAGGESSPSLALAFGTTRGNIWLIVKRKAWCHVA